MNDRGISVLEHYDLKVLRTYKGRGAIICETNQGLKILREFSGSLQKACLQDELMNHIKQRGISRIDCYVRNAEGEIVTCDKDRTGYVLKDWFEGRECDVKNDAEIKKAVKNLALLHKAMQMKDHPMLGEMKPGYISREYGKHTRELKKIRQYMREKSQKTDFEVFFLNCFDTFYREALEIQKMMDGWDDRAYVDKIRDTGQLCHGEYVYHNLLMDRQGIATVNFEKFALDMGVRDLYQFMRKILEKNNWNRDLGLAMMETYQSERQLGKDERYHLWLQLAYPEKFWKLANYYYNSRKSWVPEKSREKLKKLVEQNRTKRQLIEKWAAGPYI